MSLNSGAAAVAQRIADDAEALGADVRRIDGGGLLVDCGVKARGGLEAGRLLAETCLAGLGSVHLSRGAVTGVDVVVSTDQPVAACMGAQYAGWQIAPDDADGYFAMGSGPMRAAAAKEPLIEQLGCRERPERVVGVLETGRLPAAEVFRYIAEACGVEPPDVTLLTARTASLAGAVQVVARSVETALHKLHELGFDLAAVRSGFGAAPLPPVAADDLQAIGWTNDAVLYGAEVTLWIDADDEQLAEVGPRVPSSASQDYGAPFADIFQRHGGDFYQIDPHLFSPAQIHLQSLRSGRRASFGRRDDDLLRKSFRLT